jgi:SET domain-containing protein
MGLIIRSSDIHAAGCYTTGPIKAGVHIIEYTGERMPKDRADELYENRAYTYLFGLEDGVTVIDGYGMAMYINHSCNPNCETEEDEQGQVWVIATRDIQPGEELTYDYLLYDGEDDAPCTCGAINCKGTMYSADELKKQAKQAKKAASKKSRKKTAGKKVLAKKPVSKKTVGMKNPSRNGREK